jgi:ribosomal protein L36
MISLSATALKAVRSVLSPIVQTNAIGKCLFTNYQRCSIISSYQTIFRPTQQLLRPSTITVEQTRAYQPRGVPKLRCRHCYFVTRHGQLFVECTSKKRHRQFQIIGKTRRFKDDLTKGRFKEFVYSDFKHRRFYRFGESMWTKEDLIGDRIGKDL